MVVDHVMRRRLMFGPAPTFIAVVQMWYRRKEQTTRNASWYAMLGVVNMVRYALQQLEKLIKVF